MILKEKSDNSILNVGELVEKKFTLSSNSKMFSILSDKLYSNKVLAPIRELGTNAYDSHVEAGIDEKFIVTLPCVDDPYYSVQDFGVGMDKEQIENLYTVYGLSSKENDNNYVGCLGLGSKSPFAYTDSFSIISVKNGKKYIYKCWMDCGVPKLAFMYECDTNERNGVKISFLVKEDDFDKFKTETINFYKFWENKPTIVGLSDSDFEKFSFEKIYELDNTLFLRNKLNRNNYYCTMNELYIMMGNIVYSINKSKLSKFLDPNVNSWVSRSSYNILFKVNIGDVMMTVSRESLDDTDENYKFISEIATTSFNKIKHKFNEELNSVNTIFEKSKIINQYSCIGIININSTEVVNIKDQCVVDLTQFTNPVVKSYYMGGWKKRVNNTGEEDTSFNYFNLFSFESKVRCYYSSKKTGYTNFISEDLKNDNIYYAKVIFDKELKNYLNSIGIEVVDVDFVPVSKQKGLSSLCVYIDDGWSYASVNTRSAWKKIDSTVFDNLIDKHYYFILNGNNVEADEFVSLPQFNNIKDLIGCKNVYGVRKSSLKFVIGRKNWININDYIKEWKNKNYAKYFDNYAKYLLAKKYSFDDVDIYLEFVNGVGLEKFNLDKEKFESVKSICKHFDTNNYNSAIFRLFDDYSGKTNFYVDIVDKFVENISSNYKLFEIFNFYCKRNYSSKKNKKDILKELIEFYK